MSHSFNKIWIHAVWGTKFRGNIITPNIETILYSFLETQLNELGCKPIIINGMPDHVHALFLLSRNKNISEVIKQLKGSSSHYINQQDFVKEKFAWQTGYGAFSVSESGKQKVYQYIKNQKQHHAVKSFDQEFDTFLKLHQIENPDI